MEAPTPRGATAPLLRCQGCGAAVEYDARSCTYCRSAIATVPCHRCLQLSPIGASHCAACGAELGLAPAPEQDELHCPACSPPLKGAGQEAEATGTTAGVALERYLVPADDNAPEHILRDCPSCGGQFLEPDVLKRLLVAQPVFRLPGERLPAPEPRSAGVVRYLPCPVCQKLMNRSHFGGASGVIVNRCGKHGLWLDRGELPRILRFVAAGGLDLERERELARKRASRSVPPPALLGLANSESPGSLDALALEALEPLGPALLEFFAWLGGSVSDWVRDRRG